MTSKEYRAVNVPEDVPVAIGDLMEWKNLSANIVSLYVGGPVAGVNFGEEFLGMRVAKTPGFKGIFIQTKGLVDKPV